MSQEKPQKFPYFAEETSAEVVIARMSPDTDPRFREIMTSVIRHLHAVVKETRLTQAAWMTAIQFLTRTGQMCSDWRQEFILISDTLGVSMLVDTINNDHSGATENTVLGPFYVANPPHYENGHNICLDGKGQPLVVRGKVTDVEGRPIAGATVDAWQTNEDGFYDVQQKGVQPEMNLRGIFTTDAEGHYWFRTVKPRFYPIPGDGTAGEMLRGMGRGTLRAAHIHFIARAPGYEEVITHVFPPDCPYLGIDAVFGVKESLIGDFQLSHDEAEAKSLGFTTPFWKVDWNFALAKSK